MQDNAALTIYDDTILPLNAVKMEKVASGFQFTEGPVWHPDGYLLFSDTPANKVWRLLPDGTSSVYIADSGFTGNSTADLSDMIGSNGLAITADNELILCQHGNHAIARLDREHNLSILTGHYAGRPLNSPNDVVIRSDGSIWFTDPPYGLKDQVLHPDVFQPRGGVYRYHEGKTVLICEDLLYPNGICFSPDESRLYVSSNHADEPFLWQYDLSATGEITSRSVLIRQNADGIKTDKKGNLFLCTDEGVLIVSPEGKKIALIRLPDSPANIAFLPDHTGFYSTARSTIYYIHGLSA